MEKMGGGRGDRDHPVGTAHSEEGRVGRDSQHVGLDVYLKQRGHRRIRVKSLQALQLAAVV